MKIALVCPYDFSYHGGVQNHVLDYAERVKDLGHDVTVIAPNSKTVDYAGFFSAGNAIPFPVGRGTVSRLTFSFWNRNKLRELLANGGFDVVHVHEPVAPILGPLAMRYADTGSTALVTTSHTNISPNPVTWAYSTLARQLGMDHLIEKATTRIAVSEAAAKRANHYLQGQYMIIPNGIDVERFSPDAKPIPQYLDGKINILFVGRMGNNEKRKGLYYLVSAFYELHWKQPNTRLLIVGPGEPDDATRGLIAAAGNKNIVMVGPVSAKDLPRFYQTSDIFAAIPLNGESFSYVNAEAMASGKPVITSNIPGPREVLLGSSNFSSEVISSRSFVAEAGILVKPKEVETAAEQLEWLVLHEEARIKMGNAGREIVVKNFSWDVVVPQVLAVYEKAIAAKRQRKTVAAKA